MLSAEFMALINAAGSPTVRCRMEPTGTLKQKLLTRSKRKVCRKRRWA
jgi:hypothetical protein